MKRLCFYTFRNAVSAVVEKVQYNAFVTRSRGLFEEDRPIFTLLVALEIEDSLGRIAIGEREFLISPPFGASIKQLAYPKWEIPPKTLAKKPFDWMLDEQYHNLQVRQLKPWSNACNISYFIQHLPHKVL